MLVPSRLETLDYDSGPELGIMCGTELGIVLGGWGWSQLAPVTIPRSEPTPKH